MLNFKNLISNLKAPIINGIYTVENQFYGFNILSKSKSHIEIKTEPPIDIKKMHFKGFSHLDSVGSARFEEFECLYGEGSYGSDGFAILKRNSTPIWVLFSPQINPIISAKKHDNSLILENNLDQTIEIPIFIER